MKEGRGVIHPIIASDEINNMLTSKIYDLEDDMEDLKYELALEWRE